MVAAMAVLTVNDTIAKWLTQTVPVGQVLTVRGCITVVLALAWAATSGRLAELRVRRWRLHLLRSEEHTSELQSLMRISYAVFCLKKKNEKPGDSTSSHIESS